jgi:hypothetical protein
VNIQQTSYPGLFKLKVSQELERFNVNSRVVARLSPAKVTDFAHIVMQKLITAVGKTFLGPTNG